MKKFLKITKYVAFSLVMLVLVVEGYVFASKVFFKNPQPKVFGYSRAVVLSDSMKPEFVEDDLLFFKKQDSYEVGDIIIFNDGWSLTTHRIVDIIEDGKFVTKGDANNVNDAVAVAISDVHGKVIGKVEKVGAVFKFFQTPIGLMLIVVAAFCIIEVPNIIKHSKQKEKSKSKE